MMLTTMALLTIAGDMLAQGTATTGATGASASGSGGFTQGTGYTNYEITPAEFKGKGVDVTTLVNSSKTSAEKVYLYNVETDRFFNAGGYWGTQTATNTVGLPVTLGYTSSGITMTVAYQNSGSGQGNYVGFVNSGISSGVNGFFCDRDLSTTTSTSGYGSTYWTFTRVTDSKYGFGSDEYVYTLQANNNYMYDDSVLTISRLQYKTNNMVYPSTTAPTSQSNLNRAKSGMWKIATHKELIEDFENTYDHTIDPSDATFLIRGQGFNRQSKYVTFATSGTPTYNAGWYNLSGMTTEVNANTNHFAYTETTEADAKDDQIYAMFYNVRIKEGKAGNELVQRIVAPRRGWYRLDCEGFYHRSDKSKDADQAIAELFARVDTSGVKLATGNTDPEFFDHPTTPTSQYTFTTLWAKESIAPKDTSLTTMKSIGEAFYYDYFPVHTYFYARQDTTTIEIGIRLREDVTSGEDWVCFDDFELKFVGDEVVLSEREASINEHDDPVDYKNRLLLLERKLSTSSWNTFCMPFNMTREAFQTSFGYEAELAQFKGANEKNQLVIQSIDIAQYARTDTLLKKGQAYFVKTAQPCKDETYYAYTYNQTSPVYYYYTVERTSFNKEKLQKEGGDDLHYNSEHFSHHLEGQTDDCELTMASTYVATQAPANSYVYSGGKMKFITKATKTKGYRAWIVDKHQEGQQAKRHSVFTAMEFDGITDDISAPMMEELFGQAPEPREGECVYDLSGRMVRDGSTSLDGLPKGLYIVNGRKYVKN